jgi:hypothetical protein
VWKDHFVKNSLVTLPNSLRRGKTYNTKSDLWLASLQQTVELTVLQAVLWSIYFIWTSKCEGVWGKTWMYEIYMVMKYWHIRDYVVWNAWQLVSLWICSFMLTVKAICSVNKRPKCSVVLLFSKKLENRCYRSPAYIISFELSTVPVNVDLSWMWPGPDVGIPKKVSLVGSWRVLRPVVPPTDFSSTLVPPKGWQNWIHRWWRWWPPTFKGSHSYHY